MMRASAERAPIGSASCLIIDDRCAPTTVDRIIREVNPYLKRAAKRIAAEYPAIIDDLIQEALIILWEIDLGRFAQEDGEYLKRMLCTRMIRIYHRECRAGLTTGWSKHVEDGTAPVAGGGTASMKSAQRAPNAAHSGPIRSVLAQNTGSPQDS
jgi:DNA-directed RNA polymerase specialized sigma24 family protein